MTCEYCSSGNTREILYPNIRRRYREKIAPPPGVVDRDIYGEEKWKDCFLEESYTKCLNCGAVWTLEPVISAENFYYIRRYLSPDHLQRCFENWRDIASQPGVMIILKTASGLLEVPASDIDLDTYHDSLYWSELRRCMRPA